MIILRMFCYFVLNMLFASCSDVPLPCTPDAPTITLEDLKVVEKNSVAKLKQCYTYNCAAKLEKWYVNIHKHMYMYSLFRRYYNQIFCVLLVCYGHEGGGFVMEFLQSHRVYQPGEDELHKPYMVALW